MIFSSIKNGDSFEKYPAAIQTALEYLKSHDFAAMESVYMRSREKISMLRYLMP